MHRPAYAGRSQQKKTKKRIAMSVELLAPLADWSSLDTWIVITAALAAMACTLPGCYLVLRGQSMLGDALSHTVLPGIAGAFFVTHGLRSAGLISHEAYTASWHAAIFAGAVAIGIATAVLTEAVQKLGGVESSAALGVVYTSLFALGLLLIRLTADLVDLDPGCVLYGSIETVVLDTVPGTLIPRAAVTNGAVLVINLLLVALFFKELRIATFDPSLATTLGIHASLIQYALTAATAVTLVAAFESVGSILVIAMLIVPAATALIVTDRLGAMVPVSLVVAAFCAFLGHVLAIVIPPAVFGPLGFDSVLDASTAGMMAVAAGLVFVVAMLASPTRGVVSQAVRLALLRLRIACEDVLGLLYRLEEMHPQEQAASVLDLAPQFLGKGKFATRLALYKLRRENKIVAVGDGYRLTDTGRAAAAGIVRSHRLWESYLSAHFNLRGAREHELAHRTEHYIGPELREELASELGEPGVDPHGRDIPPTAAR